MDTPFFHSLEIERIRRETEDAILIQFAVPENLRSVFKSIAGQYVSLKDRVGETFLTRCYSICRQDAQGRFFRVAVKKIEDGRFSNHLFQNLVEGAKLEVSAPLGNFVLNPDFAAAPSPYFTGICAGSGITPLMAILRQVLEESNEAGFSLIYQNRTRSQTLFREELLDLKNRFPARFNLIFMFSGERSDTEIHNGRLNAEKLGLLFDRYEGVSGSGQYFLCGPEAMTQAASDFLISRKVPVERITRELFVNQGQSLGMLEKARREIPRGRGDCDLEVCLNGVVSNFSVSRRETILDSLLSQGVQAPHACRGGVCSTCKVKVLRGEVRMPVNYALEKEQLENRVVLSCCGFPDSDRLSVSFDIS